MNEVIVCCPTMHKTLLYGSSLVELQEIDIRNKAYKKINENFEQVELKEGQIWVINDEFSELEGEPFKVCPWCKTPIEAIHKARELMNKNV